MTAALVAQQVTTLDATNVRALRNADQIIFRLYQGQGTVEATKEGRNNPDGFDAKHVVFTSSSVRDYGKDFAYVGPDAASRYTGFHMEHSAKYSDTCKTLMGQLSVGDTLSLLWTRDNNTELLREARLHNDEVHLVITKKSGKKLTFLVRSSTGRDNTARMIQIAREF